MITEREGEKMLSHNKMTEVLLTVGWADHHPYLFTFIQVVPVTALIVAGFNIIMKAIFRVRYEKSNR